MRALLNPGALLSIALAPLGALAAVSDGCGPVDDPQQLARTARIILVGEMHGTREFPALVARLACQALEAGRPLTLALEMPHEEEARLAAYVASDGDKGQPPRTAPGTRDEHMAARVRQAAQAAPEGVLIALTGNMHKRLAPFEARDMHVRIDTPMGVLLRDLAPVSIGSERTRGAFFACMPECRVHGAENSGPALAVPRIAPAPKRDRAPYTHLVELGHTTASLPAVDAGD